MSSPYRWPDAPAHWPQNLREEFIANRGNGRVGTKLVSETDKVRVWHLSLEPGERIEFHTHVLDYFWTAMTAGNALSRYGDGGIREVSYVVGDTQHHVYGPGEFMVHDLENVGDTTLVFATVEFLGSANEPLKLESAGDLSRVA
jgi:quercetin dioxygenase-like cupin family protein